MPDPTLNGEEWDIAYTVLVSVFIFGLLPLSIISFITIRRKKDAARRGFLWLKLALILMLIGIILITAENIMLVLLNTQTVRGSLTTTHSYVEALSRLSGWGYFLLDLSCLSTFLAILDVALGILYCWDTGRKRQTLVRYIAYGLMIVEAILLLARFAGLQAWYTAYYGYLGNYRSSRGISFMSQLATWQKVTSATDIILGVASIALVGLVISVKVARQRVDHRQTATLTLVASILFCIRSLWPLVSAVMWLATMDELPDTWTLMLDAILGPWLQFTALVLLYVIGRKKLGGLWSTVQNFAASKQQYYGYGDQPVVHHSYGQP
ncbi:hypothetical protein SUNI508_13844 [Seiridium unicorne]|uniref:Uncharacterized protein n=1 Tax=Seiridium unicorne TaxID=138068 RepID=A0ABR2VAQ8_9PEZI